MGIGSPERGKASGSVPNTYNVTRQGAPVKGILLEMRTISVLDDVPARRSDQTIIAEHTEDRTIQGSHQTYTKCQRSNTNPMHYASKVGSFHAATKAHTKQAYHVISKIAANMGSILFISLFFIVCSRNVEGAGGGSRTRRDGAYLSVLRLRWWRALRRSLRSVQPPGCSQGTPIPSLYLSCVSMGVVLQAPD